jgi:hypothetical protein
MKDLPTRIKSIEETLIAINARQVVAQQTKEALCQAQHQQFLVKVGGAVLGVGTAVCAICAGVEKVVKLLKH